jgi:DNA excision repair protein ERCC-3
MEFRPENPLIVQSDHTLLLETTGPHFAPARDALARFAELVKSPEYIHTYRLTALSLWNAAASGETVEEVNAALSRWCKFPVPPNVPNWIRNTMGRFGRLKLIRSSSDGALNLVGDQPVFMLEVRGSRGVSEFLGAELDECTSFVDEGNRGLLKQALVKVGYPVRDEAGFIDGDALSVELHDQDAGGDWGLRDYQTQAVEAFLAGPDGKGMGGSGVVVLPCGAGKTIVGLAAMARLGMRTLILCTNVTALRQWRDEIIARTSLTEEEVCEYSGSSKLVGPVTLSTYQMLTWRPSRDDEFVHFGLFDRENWGLVIYDEVHLLPAPVFRTVARLQARRRLGLTATLVREDGHQSDVFALIGPKRFDMPWKDLEHQGWIAQAICTEIRVGMADDDRMAYALADDRERYRIAATNARKGQVVDRILAQHDGERVLIIGMYLDQLNQLADDRDLPLITGKTRQDERDRLFESFRSGKLHTLVLSKVGNFSVDLPDANVAIQVSGTWGSRQEEAQRLGRVLRPKPGTGNKAHFYTLLTLESVEQEFGERRQLFLAEQGYTYAIETHL